MTTQKFMGRNQLIDRLAAQVGDRAKALAILEKRGHVLKPGGGQGVGALALRGESRPTALMIPSPGRAAQLIQR